MNGGQKFITVVLGVALLCTIIGTVSDNQVKIEQEKTKQIELEQHKILEEETGK